MKGRKEEIFCPRCAKPVGWNGNLYRPFCSEKCRMIDLGMWISEQYLIPGEPADSSLLPDPEEDRIAQNTSKDR